MVPSSLRTGAGRRRTVARETADGASRVAAPDGMPADAAGRVRAAAAQLRRCDASAAREADYLDARARLGVLADGFFDGGFDARVAADVAKVAASDAEVIGRVPRLADLAELAAARVREALGEVTKETLGKVGEAGRDGSARVLDHHRDEQPAGHGPAREQRP